MPEDDISEQDLYDLILTRLKEAGAEELANQTMQVVRRGAVIQGDDEAAKGKTKALRPMQPQEALAVALEFLLTALQVPLMVEKATSTFECAKIIWHPDGPPDIVAPVEPINDAEAGLPFEQTVEGRDMEEKDRASLRESILRFDVEGSSLLMTIPLDFDLVTLHKTLLQAVDNAHILSMLALSEEYARAQALQTGCGMSR